MAFSKIESVEKFSRAFITSSFSMTSSLTEEFDLTISNHSLFKASSAENLLHVSKETIFLISWGTSVETSFHTLFLNVRLYFVTLFKRADHIVISVERQLSGKQQVEDIADRPDVRLVRVAVSLDFGSVVLGELAFLLDAVVFDGQPGHSEVHQEYFVVGNDDIGRLDVPVQDVHRMAVAQHAQQLEDPPRDQLFVRRLVHILYVLRQRVPFDEIGDYKERLFVFEGLVVLRDVRVVEPLEVLNLLLDYEDVLLGQQLFVELLHSESPLEVVDIVAFEQPYEMSGADGDFLEDVLE
eukprot:CAMPEP_0168332832 /NCGR_PEP_ID=MMETSP0213-20121227/9213_1 /TAXON_ID=151035 /ORGANISM="Euplotes harpa, Strain FSP1.4" /LENGTH=295 /DNA_ID=CAMNT_0008336973 /DNA_START=489 /DNA_END=1376 /DNA_ORIENTATION=+